jgi:hypothetical protein
MLLHIMTLPGNICRDDPPCRQPHPRCLALPRIGLLGLRDPDFEADPFEGRRHDVSERRTDGLARALFNSTSLYSALGLILGEESRLGLCKGGGTRATWLKVADGIGVLENWRRN